MRYLGAASGAFSNNLQNVKHAKDSVNSLTNTFFAFIVVAIIVTRLISPVMTRLRKLLDAISSFQFHIVDPVERDFSDDGQELDALIEKKNKEFDDLLTKYCSQRTQ